MGWFKKWTWLKERKKWLRNKKKTFLIVCEWKNTEPSYFDKFNISTIDIEIVWTWYNTIKIIDEALEKSKKYEYDEIWCVFDADPKPSNPTQISNFNNAIFKWNKLWFWIAYSNQAFEYWLLLHFEDHQWWWMNRKDYNKKLNSYLKPLNIKYDWKTNKIINQNFFDVLYGSSEIAIKRAKKIYELFRKTNWKCTNPWSEESSTTVYLLVEKILKEERN